MKMMPKACCLILSLLTAACLPTAASLKDPDAMPDPKRPALTNAPTQETGCRDPGRDPLLVDWNPSVKDEMKDLADSGVLFVRYTACDDGKGGAATTRMEVIQGCGFGGAYGSAEAASGESGDIRIDNARDLYTNLNLSAAELRASYKDGTTWILNWAAWSKRTARDDGDRPLMRVKRSQLGGEACARATHYVRTLWLGAARWDYEAEMSYGGGADVKGAAGAGASNASSVSKRTGEGDYDYCKDTATADRTKAACRALVKVALKPIEEDVSTSAGGNEDPAATSGGKAGPPAPATAAPRAVAGVEWILSKPAGVHFTKTEITVAQFERCLTAGACRERTRKTSADNPMCNLGDPARGDHPMNCVNWEGALDFCEWLGDGGRLPTKDEWYDEASNGGRWDWPWGPSPLASCDLAVWGDGAGTNGCGRDGTWPVCSKPDGNSVSGLCDMAGNVWEWTSDWFDADRHERVLRGGSWYTDDVDRLRASAHGTDAPQYWYPDHGFRCARPR